MSLRRLWRGSTILGDPAEGWDLEQWHLAEYLRRVGLDLRDGRQPIERTWTLSTDSSFGEWLRRSRESSGRCLGSISDSTRIPIHLLQAIEENRFNDLPGGLYTREFVRQYARAVGGSPLEAIHAFDSYANAPVLSAELVQLASLAARENQGQHGIIAQIPTARAVGVRFAAVAFRVAEAVLPRRICQEELGDAFEYIGAPERTGLEVWLKAISTLIWVAANSAREIRTIFFGHSNE